MADRRQSILDRILGGIGGRRRTEQVPPMGMPERPMQSAPMGDGEQLRPDQHSAAEEMPGNGAVIVTEPTSRMTAERIGKGLDTLRRYMAGKSRHDQRIVDDELWWRLHSWDSTGRSRNPGDPEPNSAYTVNSILYKHADAMDSYPVPVCRPREPQDKQAAEMLSSVLPVVLERNGYKDTYSDLWWDKLKFGVGITGVFWDSSRENGLGDIAVKCVDPLNLFWEPGLDDIQQSRNVYHIEMVDADTLREQWPDKAADISPDKTLLPRQYHSTETRDERNKVCVVDWYYKDYSGTKPRLHYAKLAGEVLLYCSEDDPSYADRGFYDHGQYPFVLDPLFPLDDSPSGTGFIDLCKPAQAYIDKLDQSIIKYAAIASRPRWFVRDDCLVNLAQYADVERDFVSYQGSGDPSQYMQQIRVDQLPSIYAEIRNLKVEELKEVSGNRDFNQGAAPAQMAASAITALQEAGNRVSRQFVDDSRRAYVKTVLLCIELIRQFYTQERTFRITGADGREQFARMSSGVIAGGMDTIGGQEFRYEPIFDIDVSSEKQSPFSTVAQNERATNMYSMGFFDPARADQALAALEMMDFDGIETCRDRIQQGQTLYRMVSGVQELLPTIMQMAAAIDAQTGSGIGGKLSAALQGMGFQTGGMAAPVEQASAAQKTTQGAVDGISGAESRKPAVNAADGRFRVAKSVADMMG